MSHLYERLMSTFATWGCLLLLAACQSSVEDASRGPWPQFRGPDGQGVSDATELATHWSATSPNVRWRTELRGEGNSSPVVSGGRVFLTAAFQEGEGGDDVPVEFLVMGLDLASGDLLWETSIYEAPLVKGHFLNTGAAPTPVADGEHVYAYFGPMLVCLDFDGRVVWQKEIDPDYARYVRYGVASSLVLAGEAIVVFQDREWGDTPDVGWLATYDRRSGEPIWRQEWSDNCCAYSTPLVWNRGGKTELVVPHSAEVVAYEPRTGERLWSHPHQMYQMVSGFNVDGDLLCNLGGAHNNKGNLCLRVIDEDDETRVEEVWFHGPGAPETSTPVLYRGKIFAVNEIGVMSCYDAASGELLWKNRLGSKGYRSSLVAGDGKVYALSTWGVTAVINAETEEFELLASNDLGEGGNNATPAIAGGCLLIRTTEHLYCIEKESAAI